MTYRERKTRKAERLHEWADKREAKSNESYEQFKKIADFIPAGQPILVGHHSEKRHRADLARMDRRMEQVSDHQDKAEAMRQKAANIANQLDHSIYSDDPDAIEQLEQRVAELEAERNGIKAYNVSCRKGQPNVEVLNEARRRDIEGCIRLGFAGVRGEFPRFALSNLNGNINRNLKRLELLKKRQELAHKFARPEASQGLDDKER